MRLAFIVVTVWPLIVCLHPPMASIIGHTSLISYLEQKAWHNESWGGSQDVSTWWWTLLITQWLYWLFTIHSSDRHLAAQCALCCWCGMFYIKFGQCKVVSCLPQSLIHPSLFFSFLGWVSVWQVCVSGWLTIIWLGQSIMALLPWPEIPRKTQRQAEEHFLSKGKGNHVYCGNQRMNVRNWSIMLW